ncbi:MAG: glycosyltransferase family 4 protein, partial [Planctomycetota bacterium]
SSLAGRCRRLGVPFVLGPLNGGVPWPRGFDSARRREREWLSYVRGAYRLLPGYRATRRHSAAIIAGSRDTLAQMPDWCRDRCVYIPENGIDPGRFDASRPGRRPAGPLRLVFVGRLVPYKGPDMLLDAVAPLVREGAATVEIIGDGPMMDSLRRTVDAEGLGRGVALPGWVEHDAVAQRLAAADVLAFPSIREFGGGVVLEAMAVGLVPVVVDYGGPAELVTPRTGFAVPVGPRPAIVEGFRRILGELAREPQRIDPLAQAARQRVERLFTWSAKARQTLEVYRWVTGRRADRPDFGMPLDERLMTSDVVAEPAPAPAVCGTGQGG